MPSIYQPRRPRASPLWQLVHHGWSAFLANYENKHRQSLGPLHPAATATVESFLRRSDLASGFILRRHRPQSKASGWIKRIFGESVKYRFTSY